MEQLTHIFRGLLGIAVFVGLAVAFSENRRAINWRLIWTGLALQFVFAALVLHVGFVRSVIEVIGSGFVKLLDFTTEGTRFVAGSLLDTSKHGVIFGLAILPTVIFFSAFTSMLYYLGILQKVVWALAWVMSKTMKLSGAETLSASANIFLGQTEAPLLIKPYLSKMTRSEMLCIMVGGMATIAGGVMLVYITMLGGSDPQQQITFATHLITKSVISAPAALMFAKILLPQTEEVSRDLTITKEKVGSNLLDAICIGTSDGLKLAVNIAGMLIVFTALIALFNYMLSAWIGSPTGLNHWAETFSHGAYKTFSLEFVFSLIFAPLAWLMGIDSHYVMMSGQLLGTRTVLNEFVAYIQLSGLKNSGQFDDPRSLMIITYALCGFANIVSIGIQVGGIGALAPEQRGNLAKLGFKALLGGSLACFVPACIAGVLT